MSELVTKKQWQNFCGFMTDCCAILSKDFNMKDRLDFPLVHVTADDSICVVWEDAEGNKILIFDIDDIKNEDEYFYCVRREYKGQLPVFSVEEKIDKCDYKKIKEMFEWFYTVWE